MLQMISLFFYNRILLLPLLDRQDRNLAHYFLFDFGVDFHGIKRNLDLLKIDFRNIEACVISHDHFDHQTALIELINSEKENIPREVPIYIGKKFLSGVIMEAPEKNFT